MLGLLCAAAAESQTLDLGGSREPKLGEDTFAAALVDQLALEIAERDDLAATARGMIRPAVLRASGNYRRVASDLLTRADSDAPGRHVAFVMGLTLFDGREDIDDALRSLAAMLPVKEEHRELSRDDKMPMRAAQSIGVFNANWAPLADQLARNSIGELDIVVAETLMPLCEAVAMIEGARLVSHWPDLSNTRSEQQVDDTGAISRGIAAISLRAADAALSPECTATLSEITAYLRSGSSLAELRPRVRQYSSLLLEALTFAATAQQAEWLEDADRAALQNQIEVLITLFRDQSTRAEATASIERIQTSRESLDVLLELSRVRARRANMKPLGKAYLSLHRQLQNSDDSALVAEQLRTLTAIAQHMLEFRSLGGLELRGELRVTAMKLERQYDDAEKALLGELDLLVNDLGAMSNPAFNSVFNQHRQYLEDLRRVRQLPRWAKAIETLRPRAGPGFARQANKMATWLIQPARRQSAVLAMDHFDTQWETFRTLPMEEALRSRDPEVEALIGGQGAALLELIDSQRAEWAEAGAAGDAGSEPARRLAIIAQLLRLAEDYYGVAQMGDPATVMNAWAAWEIAPQGAAAMSGEPPDRVVLGVQSAIAGNDTDLNRQVDLITREAAMVRLAGRIGLMLQEKLSSLPGGALGTLGQIVSLPKGGSFMRTNRNTLAELCRYRAENRYAEAAGNDSLANRCDQHVNALAESLLMVLGERAVAIPALSEFDGSDPGGNGDP